MLQGCPPRPSKTGVASRCASSSSYITSSLRYSPRQPRGKRGWWLVACATVGRETRTSENASLFAQQGIHRGRAVSPMRRTGSKVPLSRMPPEHGTRHRTLPLLNHSRQTKLELCWCLSVRHAQGILDVVGSFCCCKDFLDIPREYLRVMHKANSLPGCIWVCSSLFCSLLSLCCSLFSVLSRLSSVSLLSSLFSTLSSLFSTLSPLFSTLSPL